MAEELPQQISTPEKPGDFWTWLEKLKTKNRKLYTLVIWMAWAMVPIGLATVYLFIAAGLENAKVANLPFRDFLWNTIGSAEAGPWINILGIIVYPIIFLIGAIVQYKRETKDDTK